ncbi:MAG TPA: nucleotidyltransferase [Methanosarcinaceae archaeon]|nr:nucleotidyltransferase [Methanosarcinaceae archaeon]HJH30818.1 nucleotidyltransferase [Methanosarcinaceae archaeon]
MSTTNRNLEKEQLIPLLEKFFQAQEYVELAYLFGSAAKGKAGVLSDIDIGIYLSPKTTKAQRNQKRLEFIAKLTTILKNNRIDLLVINDTPPVLNFEIIKPNVPVLVRDHDLKLDVEQCIMSRYLDRKYHEDFLNRTLLKKIIEKGLA